MLFLKRLIARWAVEGHASHENYEDSDRKYPSPVVTGSARGIARKKNVGTFYGDEGTGETFKNPMNITLYNAVGGRIIKFSRWDRDADTTLETTYVINNDENFFPNYISEITSYLNN